MAAELPLKLIDGPLPATLLNDIVEKIQVVHKDASGVQPKVGSEQSQNPATEFTCFDKFPVEIRLKIWKTTCFITRNVDITAHVWELASSDMIESLCFPHRFSSYCLPPSVLAVCRESRAEALKHYTLDFGVTTTFERSPQFSITHPPKIYFNWQSDRLCLINPFYCQGEDDDECRYWWTDLQQRCKEKKLRFFACNTWEDMEDYGPDDDFLNFIPWHKHLEEVVLFSKALETNYRYERDSLPQVFGPITFVDCPSAHTDLVAEWEENINWKYDTNAYPEWLRLSFRYSAQNIKKQVIERSDEHSWYSNIRLQICDFQMVYRVQDCNLPVGMILEDFHRCSVDEQGNRRKISGGKYKPC